MRRLLRRYESCLLAFVFSGLIWMMLFLGCASGPSLTQSAEIAEQGLVATGIAAEAALRAVAGAQVVAMEACGTLPQGERSACLGELDVDLTGLATQLGYTYDELVRILDEYKQLLRRAERLKRAADARTCQDCAER